MSETSSIQSHKSRGLSRAPKTGGRITKRTSREIIWGDDAKDACIDVLEDKHVQAPVAPAVDPVPDARATHQKVAKADDRRKLQATTISQRLQECSMVVKFAFKRKDNPSYPPNAGESDYDGMLEALGQADRSNLKFYERELDRLNDALVAQGEDYTIGIVYALPLLASDGTEIAQSILMREQEGGPIFWAAVKKWLAEKTVKTVGNMRDFSLKPTALCCSTTALDSES